MLASFWRWNEPGLELKDPGPKVRLVLILDKARGRNILNLEKLSKLIVRLLASIKLDNLHSGGLFLLNCRLRVRLHREDCIRPLELV